MRGRVLKSFRYSTDGLRAIDLGVGDEREFADDMAPGLVREGWIVEVLPEIAQPVETAVRESVGTGVPMTGNPANAEITNQPAPAAAQPKRGRR